MSRNTSRGFLARYLAAFVIVGFSPLQSSGDAPTDVQVIIVKIEEVHNIVYIRLKMVNRLPRPVYVAGIKFDRPEPYPVLLEQWRADGGWTAVAPCMDVPPPQVMRLGPGKALVSDCRLRVFPAKVGVCVPPNLQSGGRFRYRLDYFMSEREAHAYLDTVYSPGHQPQRDHVALSEPFEISPAKNRR